MTDPVGLAGAGGAGGVGGGVGPVRGPGAGSRSDAPASGPGSFKDLLLDNIRSVNELQRSATEAIEDLQAGRRNDVETVLMATQKADTAFRMLLATRNKVLEAYDEIRQIRV